MANTVNINFKLDSDVKKSMEAACAEMGLTMSAAFTVYAKKVGREKRIPFEITAYSEPNSVTYAAMEASENETDIHGPFDSVSELMEALNA